MGVLIRTYKSVEDALKEVEKLREVDFGEYVKLVKPVVDRVRNEGDSAIIEFTEKFDGVRLESIRVRDEEIDRAYEIVADDVIDALEVARENVERFHSITAVERDVRIDFGDCVLGKRYTAIEKVGAYIPGGKASYPSTAIMVGVPAKIAGVKRLVACTPPNSKGSVNPLTLVALDMAGFDEIYSVGGAQAVAAMAYGTESVEKVYKIVGPGNVYVTAAKLLVSMDVAIDMPAGPSEILVVADETANAAFVAVDCLAQLEHGEHTVAVVATDSGRFADEVAKNLENLGLDKAVGGDVKILILPSIEDAMEFANAFAAEHLVLNFEGAEDYIDRVENAGSVFVGDYSPVAAGDYASGTNHVLPTSGYTRFFGGLSVESFMKHHTYQILSEEALKRIGEAVVKLAEAEGLEFHAESIRKRLEGSF